MRRATLFNYNIPIVPGVVLRDRRVTSRYGLLIGLEEAGREGWGEIAPLPGFSLETLAQAQDEAVCWLQKWCEGKAATRALLPPQENLSSGMALNSSLPPQEKLSPSVAFGLSCALAELAAVMPSTGNYQSAMLCTGDPDELIVQLNQRPQPVAKMKVGMYEAVRDGMTASILLEAVPNLTLRLDANRQWSPDKARQFARFVPETLRPRITFIEEPCRTQEESRSFSRETGIALAWDESTRESGFQPVAEPHLRAIVIKPTLTGSLAATASLAARAQSAGLSVVISSALESSLGLTQLARIANWLTPGVAPGLDTLSLMQRQLARAWPDSPLPLLTADKLEKVWQR